MKKLLVILLIVISGCHQHHYESEVELTYDLRVLKLQFVSLEAQHMAASMFLYEAVNQSRKNDNKLIKIIEELHEQEITNE